MAEKKKFSKINYNPIDLENMTEREIRAVYSELRKIATKRVKRLISEGYGDYKIAKAKFSRSRDLDFNDVSAALLDVSLYLRDPRTRAAKLKKMEAKLDRTLTEHGYTIPKNKLKDFGDYMDAMAAKYKGKIMPKSDIVADLWEQAERLGMSGKTLIRHFEEWLDDKDKIEKVHDVLEITSLPKNRSRLSSTELNLLLSGKNPFEKE